MAARSASQVLSPDAAPSRESGQKRGILPYGKVSLEAFGVRAVKPSRTLQAVVVRAGTGMACQEAADEWSTWVCPVDGSKVRFRKTCSQERTCPRCYKAWAAREGVVAGHRLSQVGQRHALLEPRHVVVSFLGQSVVNGREYGEGFRRAWAVLKAMGSRGGALVFHPERHVSECSEVIWRLGPHYHAIVWGWVDSDKRPPGVVVKTIGEQTSLEGTFSYLLDHAGVVERLHAVRYVGLATYRKTPGILAPDRRVPLCPQCQGAMVLESVMDGPKEVLIWSEGERWRS